VAIAAIALAVCLAASGVAEEVVPEYQLKAEFMERFTRFVDWPTGSPVNDGHTPFAICVVGDDPFGPYLRNLAATRKIKSKQVAVKAAPSDLDGCHMLFIAGSHRAQLGDLMRRTADKPILTVADSPGFAEAGVMVNFYRADDKIRFEINPRAAEKRGLHVKSKLLMLARVVGGE
jgi:hypothetical protein